MSLATTGAGGGMAGGAGLSVAAMAHNTHAPAHTHSHAHHGHSQIPGGGGATMGVPGTSYAALGADLLDKNQAFLNAKNVRNVAKLPIVAVDLYGDKGHVAYFPPMEEEKKNGKEGEQEDEMAVMMKVVAKMRKGVLARSVGGLYDNDGNANPNGGKDANDGTEERGADVILKREEDGAYKAVKRYLSKGMGHGTVLEEAMLGNYDETVNGGSPDGGDNSSALVIPRPHLIMGTRSTFEFSEGARANFSSILPKEDTADASGTSAVIDHAPTHSALSLTTINLDGNSPPKGDDYDRVAFQMKLHSKKKLMTILPEEAVGLLMAKAKKNARDAFLKEHPDSELNPANGTSSENGSEPNGNLDDEDTYLDYPPAIAIPGWATTDSTLEALLDATGGSSSTCGPSLHQRSIAACIGALLPPPNHPGSTTPNAPPKEMPVSKLTKLLKEICDAKDKEAAQEAAKEAAREKLMEPRQPDPYVPLVLLLGATREGIEMTAVQLSKPQTPTEELHCPFGNVNVVSSVCYSHEEPLSLVKRGLDELRRQVGVVVPESEEPVGIVTYGEIGSQVGLASRVKAVLKGYGKDAKTKGGDGSDEEDDEFDGWDQDIPILSTKESCVALGLATLAASVHGRVRVIVQVKGTDGKRRPKARLGVSVQDVATCAVAVSFNYFGGHKDEKGLVEKWTKPKVIFDFDRRVPAGPYQIDFSAADCAAHVRHVKKNGGCCIEDEEKLLEEAQKVEGSRGIPEREAAALQLRFRIHQKVRCSDDIEDGEDVEKWIRVGNDMRPLSMEHSQKEEGESGEDHLVALESAVLEISLSSVGTITTGLTTNGETIVQATKSARNSKLLKYLGIIGSILFFGGFLVKSYVEERIFERDTQRVLAFYKRAAPNSIHDGDERQARYLVWKYKGKKEKLWRRLEAKYGMEVKHAWEWEDEIDGEEEGKEKKEEEEEEDLDGDENEDDGEEL